MLELFKIIVNKLFGIVYQPVIPQRIHWTPELVEGFWNGISKTQLEELSFSRTGGRSFIVAIDHLLPPQGRILDFGAGDGNLIRLMCERGLKVAGYEPSRGRLEILKEQLHCYPSFLGMIDANSNETFDVVIMTEVIEHIIEEQLDKTLSQVKALTRPGGILIVTTPDNEDLERGMSYCPVSNILFHRWQHMRSFTNQSLAILLANYGFEEIITHQITFDDNLFIKYDKFWGSKTAISNPPSYIMELRENRPVQTNGMGESELLYIGRRPK